MANLCVRVLYVLVANEKQATLFKVICVPYKTVLAMDPCLARHT